MSNRVELNPETCWQAVLSRDAGQDGRFVYAVQSTGVFCRPSCPSRRPRRERAVFFADPGSARHAGYRPCRRCRPEAMERADEVAVRRACAAIDAASGEAMSAVDLAQAAGISARHLRRAFQRVLGVTPRQYADACRARLLKSNLRQGNGIAGAVYESGYGSSSRVYERAPAQLGMTPGEYRRGAAGIPIRYTTAACFLGRVLVASTPRGVCSVKLGDADGTLVADLQREFPGADVRADRNGLRSALDAVLANLRSGAAVNLPLDLQATAFQRRVWDALRAIPRGETRTYAEVARTLGAPRAARAVARACASNPVALVVPCHRVVRGDGQAGGYRWGMEKKAELLKREQHSLDEIKRGAR